MVAGFSNPLAAVPYRPGPRSRQDEIAQALMKRGGSTAPTNKWGALARLAQGLLGGYMSKLDQDDRSAADAALMRGATGPEWINNMDTGGANQTPIQGAMSALGGLEDNQYASNMRRRLFGQQLMQDQGRAALEEKRKFEAGVAEQEHGRAVELKSIFPPGKPVAPKTVNVNGKVHILNPDGTLGSPLGDQKRYVPVPGVGVFNPATGQYVGQTDSAPPTSQQLPVPTGDPTRKLPPAKQGAARADEIKQANMELKKMRGALDEMRVVARAARRFGELNRIQETGGFLRNIPGAQWAEGAFNEEIREMASIIDRITPLMRQGLPGAASERDTRMFRGAAFGTDKTRKTNANMILGFLTSLELAEDQIAFKEAYVSQNATMRGAEPAWREYLEANPIFNHDADPRRVELNQGRQSWQDFFSGISLAAPVSGKNTPGFAVTITLPKEGAAK